MHLLRTWPGEAVLTSNYLGNQFDISISLLQHYLEAGWIKSVGKGAYRFPQLDDKGKEKPLTWKGGLYGLQVDPKYNSKNVQIFAAAKTALELAGYAHYVKLGKNESVWLFTEPGYRTPTWFISYPWNVKINVHNSRLFSKPMPATLSDVLSPGGWFIKASCPERAMMEMLELCPNNESLDHAKKIMEMLTALRPKVVTELLNSCTSVKVKRLFLAMADLCGHDWLKEINLSKVDRGSGDRVLKPGLGFHSKYRISIPTEDNG